MELGGKKVRARKRHILLVDTEGLVVEARVHSAKVPETRTGSGAYYLEPARDRLPRLSYLWVDALAIEVEARSGPRRRLARRLRS